jgi:putative flippase GtrA
MSLIQNQKLVQFLRYALCGGFGVLLDVTLFWLITWAGVGYQIANVFGYASGTIMSFILNRHFTFQSYDETFRRMGLFALVAGVGYTASAVTLWFLVERLDVPPLYAKIATLFLVLVIQFSLNRSITFRQRQSS